VLRRLFRIVKAEIQRLRTRAYPHWRDSSYVSTEDPVVIGGAGRSGTTLLSAILNAHPAIYCGDEQRLLVRDGVSVAHISDPLQLSQERVHEVALDSDTRGQFLEQTIRVAKDEHGASLFATKYPAYAFELRWIFETFPNARFVHMCRDGRDVAVSLREHEDQIGARYDATYDEEGRLSMTYCAENWRTFVNAVRPYLEDARVHTVHYEDLARSPEQTARSLFSFLDVKEDLTAVEQHQRGLEGRTSSQHEHHQRLGEEINDDRVGRWRSALTDAQVNRYEQIAGDELDLLGYR